MIARVWPAWGAVLLAFGGAVGAQVPAGEATAPISAIPGVVAGNVAWERIASLPMTADGMATGTRGEVLFAQEQSNAIWRLHANGALFVEVPYVLGAGAVSVAADGSILAVERGCTDPGLGGLECNRPGRVVMLAPRAGAIAATFANGAPLGRLNDLEADNRGGAWFTQGALYHVSAAGEVSEVYRPQAFTNGLATSPDGRRLYVTDSRVVMAFDLDDQGQAGRAREFARLDEDTKGFGGDGMAVDMAGRVYVTGDAGIYVFAPDGARLGLIPVPRRAITLTFAGADRRDLYVGAMGALRPDLAEWQTGEGVRNVAMTIYRLEMLAKGQR